MNRQDIESEYSVRDGIIRSPGKFEGEMTYAPHFYEFASDGEELSYMEDGCGVYASLITVDADDVAEWSELEGVKYVLLQENSDGFVSCFEITAETDADRLRAEFEHTEEEQEQS